MGGAAGARCRGFCTAERGRTPAASGAARDRRLSRLLAPGIGGLALRRRDPERARSASGAGGARLRGGRISLGARRHRRRPSGTPPHPRSAPGASAHRSRAAPSARRDRVPDWRGAVKLNLTTIGLAALAALGGAFFLGGLYGPALMQ